MSTRERFVAKYAMRDGGWVVTSEANGSSVASYGRTLEKARQHITAAIDKSFKLYPGTLIIDDAIAISASASNAVKRARAAKDEALKATAHSNAATGTAVRKLDAEGLSLRDIAYVLGISHSRVHQIIGLADRAKGSSRA